MSENYGLRPEFEKPEDVNLKNCALGGSIILSTGGSIFVSAEARLNRPRSDIEHSSLKEFDVATKAGDAELISLLQSS